MLYSTKKKLDRRNSIMAAVKKELKANNAYVPPEALKALAEALDTALYYEIKIVRNPDDAAHEIIVYYEWDEDSFSDEEHQTGKIIYGNAQVFDVDHEDSAVFDMNQPFIALMDYYMIYSRSSADVPDKHWIVIYSPESIIDEAQYTAQKNAELEELCKLR